MRALRRVTKDTDPGLRARYPKAGLAPGPSAGIPKSHISRNLTGDSAFELRSFSSSSAASAIWCAHPLQLFMLARVQVAIASAQRRCSPQAPVSRAGNRFAKPGCAIGPSCSSLFGLSGIIIKRPRWHDVTPPPSRSPILDCGLPVPTLGAAALLAQSHSSCPLQSDLSRLRQSRARN